MVSQKRRAQEPPSSSRSCKQPRLSPPDQNDSLSQASEKKETGIIGTACRFGSLVHKTFTLIFDFPLPSSRHLSLEDKISHEETIPARSISPKGMQKRVRSLSSSSNVVSTPEEDSDSTSSSEDREEIDLWLKDVDNSLLDSRHSSLESSRIPVSLFSTRPTLQSKETSTPRKTRELTDSLLVAKVNKIQLHSSHSSLQSSQITGSSFSRGSTVQSKETSMSRKTRVRSKPHIYHGRHKAATREINRLAVKSRLYQVMKHHRKLVNGHFVKADAMSLADYQILLQKVVVERQPLSFPRLKSPRISRAFYESELSMKRTLDNAKATLNSPRPSVPFTPSDELRKRSDRKKDADIEKRLRGLPDSLPGKEDDEVSAILRKRGVVAKFAREQVSDVDISRLKPGQWLNDEIINFYGAMILARSESNKENAQVNGKAGGSVSLDVHYFSSFFWAKLTKEGYQQGRLAKWTKKINIFSKDVILIPVNHSNAHWTAAAINFRKKRIESYDSMGIASHVVFNHLRAYLDAEHKDKKKKSFDFTGWEDVAPEDTPQQENGWDCGVFTCHFLEALSRGVETFAFAQRDMPYLRRRMIWEIGNAQLRRDYK